MEGQFLPFARAHSLVRSFCLASHTEWSAWCKTSLRPAKMPEHPDREYRYKGWQSWNHWLGTIAHHNVPRPPKSHGNKHKFRRFEEALQFARSLQLKDARA